MAEETVYIQQEGFFQKHLKGDSVIWFILIILSLISILVVYSATGSLAYKRLGGDTEYYLFKHAFLVMMGFLAAWICHKADYRIFSVTSRMALILSVPLLLFAWQYGATINEASRWITIPLINYTFQPSDMAKLALITNLASMLAKRQNSFEATDAMNQLLIWCGVICALIGLSDWSGASLLLLTCLMMLFIGRVPMKYLGMLLMVGVMAGYIAFTFGQRAGTVGSRLDMYFNMTDGEPFQAEQSYIAIASGGFTGQGAGKSMQRNFLPHPYSDFIFAIIVEEYGMIGGVVIIAMYLVLLYRGMRVVSRSSDPFGSLLCAGLTLSIVLQAFVHMAVVVGIVPITGLPLPLLSMGGTSLLFTGIAMGAIIGVSKGLDSEKEGGRLSAKMADGKKRNFSKA